LRQPGEARDDLVGDAPGVAADTRRIEADIAVKAPAASVLMRLA